MPGRNAARAMVKMVSSVCRDREGKASTERLDRDTPAQVKAIIEKPCAGGLARDYKALEEQALASNKDAEARARRRDERGERGARAGVRHVRPRVHLRAARAVVRPRPQNMRPLLSARGRERARAGRSIAHGCSLAQAGRRSESGHGSYFARFSLCAARARGVLNYRKRAF